jgi:hypothetical protein
MVFFFNFLRAFCRKEPYFVFLERNFRSFAFYKGFEVCYTKIIFCALMNMTNMHFEDTTGGLSGSLAAMFFVIN